MINTGDIYKVSEIIPIMSGEDAGTGEQIGTIFANYEVQEYIDLQNLQSVRSYIVTCKQRIVIPNANGLATLSDTSISSYDDYPIMLQTGMSIKAQPDGCSIYLLDYSPKTINTSVTTSTANSTASGSSNSTSSEQTTGRSTSDTNSYEVNGSIGFFGDMPMGSLGGSYGHSRTTSRFSSSSAGTASGSDQQNSVSGSAGMTIKDWGSYASISSATDPAWVWAQEYPWDIVQFHYVDADSGYVLLPNFIQGRLVDQTQGLVYPPSELSLFGVNFVATAKWLITTSSEYYGSDETFSISHAVSCTRASHSVGPQSDDIYSAVATLTSLTPFTSSASPQMDLVQLALDPIADEGASNGAVVGFVQSQFIALPQAPSDNFRIKSAANNILASGCGFTAPVNNDTPMTADLTAGPVTFSIYFKIVNTDANLTLYLKHWISSTTSLCYMNVVINGTSAIYRHVDAPENGSGADNITKIILRSQDLAEANFYDYLVMGMNVITVTIYPSDDPTGTAVPGVYSLRALAIG